MKRLRFVTRGAVFRLGLLALAAAVFFVWGYFSMLRMPGRSHRGPLPPLSEEEARLRDALRRRVEKLAGEIGQRNLLVFPGKLAEAAAWIEGELRELGLAVTIQDFRARGAGCRNVQAEVPGGERREEIVVVGAHYDSVAGSPGANDNSSGVAALLELARALREARPARTLRLVAFANEEPPHFQTEEMGSLVYARAAKARGERIAAMVSLETIGCYSDEPGSQSYPALLGLVYPGTGNFIGFVGNHGSRALVRECIRVFRETTAFPSEGGAPPAWVPGVGWSDHWAFWQCGYPAIMVTDTAPFRYRHYHLDTDTPDKLDYERMARVFGGLLRVVEGLLRGGG